MIYALIENGTVVEYPVYEAGIKRKFPNISFPKPFVAPEGYVEVLATEFPVVDYTKKVSEAIPSFIDGELRQQWKIEDASPEEIASYEQSIANNARASRNQRLSDSDWTQLTDAPVDAVSWASYRQELRDVPSQPGFPFNIDWPQPPA